MEIDRNLIKFNSELRADSRAQLRGQWGTALLLCVIFSLVSGAPSSIPYIGWVGTILLSGPMSLGLAICFLKLVRHEPFRIEELFDGFKNFNTSVLLYLLMNLFTFLWGLLLIVPGIIARYRYAMSFYILRDNPEMAAMDVLNASKKMMLGYKWKLFCLHFSFIGWILLSIFSCFIGLLWVIPYIKTAEANFYENLKIASQGNRLY